MLFLKLIKRFNSLFFIVLLFLLNTAIAEEVNSALPEKVPSLVFRVPEEQQFFLKLVGEMIELEEKHPFIFRLVDKKNSLAMDYEPSDLKNIDDYPQLESTRHAILLQEVALLALLDLQEAASEQGLTIPVLSGYRSYEYQQNVYNYWQKRSKNAERFSAVAGHSQHQLGTVVDLGSLSQTFSQSKEGRWLAENSCHFGFSLSYPQGEEKHTGYIYEPWHFRFIGQAACQLQQQFFANSQQNLLEFWHQLSNFSQKETTSPPFTSSLKKK